MMAGSDMGERMKRVRAEQAWSWAGAGSFLRQLGRRPQAPGGQAAVLPGGVPPDYWAQGCDELLAGLQTSAQGLSAERAARALQRYGPNLFDTQPQHSGWRLFGRQWTSPLVLILVFGAAVSLFLGEWVNASIILVIVLASALLTFSQEWRAHQVVSALQRRLALKVQVLRAGRPTWVLARQLVPGELMLLSAGQLVAADAVLIESRDCLVTQASLTGESVPVLKQPGVLAADTPLVGRSNCVYLGTTVKSGSATALVVGTGAATALGQIGLRLSALPPETEFGRGVRQFEALLMRTMLTVVLLVVVVNHWLGRPVLDSMMFAVALAVGLTPELLPAIVSITMARGAHALAKRGVMVRRLEAIEDLGGMDVLCTDKTGTITEDRISLHACLGLDTEPSAELRRLVLINAGLQSGIANPLDEAITASASDLPQLLAAVRKIDEVPYDFQRKRLSVVVQEQGQDLPLIITKGSFDTVLAVCDGAAALAARHQPWFEQVSRQGYRVLALATRSCDRQSGYSPADEQALSLQGFILFSDRLKPGMADRLRQLRELGIQTKIVSGDNRYICAQVGSEVGLNPQALLTGQALAQLSDEALWALAPRTDLFVEVDPQQKERIVHALQHGGHSVGYMGDGINDAPALHAADVGISAEHAVDVARQAADIVMLKRHLDVLHDGVILGRTTFVNTLKYIGITTSANFGNMLSMAIATPLLPWLPLLAKQILLNNL
ncbi:MAG: HAD-IC family P-type ATPase, partial [Betaproteobacteria bacterium]